MPQGIINILKLFHPHSHNLNSKALTGDVSLATSGTASTADTEEYSSRVAEMTRSCSHGSEAASWNLNGRSAQLDEKTCDQPRTTPAALTDDVSLVISGTATTVRQLNPRFQIHH